MEATEMGDTVVARPDQGASRTWRRRLWARGLKGFLGVGQAWSLARGAFGGSTAPGSEAALPPCLDAPSPLAQGA